MSVVQLVCLLRYVSVTVTNTLAYYNPEFITNVKKFTSTGSKSMGPHLRIAEKNQKRSYYSQSFD